MAIPRQRITLPPGAVTTAIAGALHGDLWAGDDITRFEQRFATLVGSREAIAMASGRAGLRAILESLELEPGCEVLCPSYGYPVVPHVVRAMGFTLRLVECDLQTLAMDPAALAAAISPKTGAVIVMHLFGVPARIRELEALCAARNIPLVEDCAHCVGATVGGRHVGTIGRVGYFSFETSKMINTLGGGMLATNDPALAQRLRAGLAGEKVRKPGWLFERLARTSFESMVTNPLGFNLGVYPALRIAQRVTKADGAFASGYQADHFTMKGRTGQYTNYQAKLGMAQLAGLDASLSRRIQVAKRLIGQLRDLVPFQEPASADTVANYMLVTGLFAERSKVSAALLRRGIDSKHHYMRDCSRALETGETFKIAARAEAEALHLPCFPEMSDAAVDRVATAVREVVAAVRRGA